MRTKRVIEVCKPLFVMPILILNDDDYDDEVVKSTLSDRANFFNNYTEV